MNIIWFTGRHFEDLCSTTQISLALGLIEKGHSMEIINPDIHNSMGDNKWKHHGLPVKALPGLKSIKLSRKMHRWLSNYNPSENTVALLDWRVANKLSPTLDKKKIPWILIDRGPPADGNLLAKLQWYFWKKSWNLVKNNSTRFGCVVSKAHRSFVEKHVGVDANSMIIIPAGVDTKMFHVSKKQKNLQLNYHGKIDKNRGIMSIIEIFVRLRKTKMNVELNIHGRGNCAKSIKKLNLEGLNLTESLKRDKLAEKLATYDIGFLPMPENKIWRIASPLKRSEYIASGMLICGVDHLGHQIENSGDWLQLFDEEKFVKSSVEWIKNLKENDLRNYQQEARIFAENNFDWKSSVEKLNQIISKQSS